MTDQERQLIHGLVSRIHDAPAPQIDRDADDLIRRGIGSRPDALYILTQTVLIQEMALNQAKAQIEDLTRQAQPAPSNTSFLGNRGGSSQTPSYQSGGYQGSNYQRDSPPPPPPPPQYDAPPPQTGGRFSGFLHNAAQTAAGVIAGEVAFSAISSLFGGHGGSGYGGGSGFFGGNSGISPGSETIINNYYDDDRDRGSDRGSLDPGLSPDVEDRRFAGSDNDIKQDDSADSPSDDDNSTDDSSVDDSSSYDDGSDSTDV